MLLSSPQADPQAHNKQIAEFKAQKAELDKSLAAWQKGQDITQLEAKAKKVLEDAKAEAAAIVANAKKGVAQIEKSRKEYDALKAELQAKIDKAKQDCADSAKALSEAEKERADALNVKGLLRKELDACAKERRYLQDRLVKLQNILTEFNGSLN